MSYVHGEINNGTHPQHRGSFRIHNDSSEWSVCRECLARYDAQEVVRFFHNESKGLSGFVA